MKRLRVLVACEKSGVIRRAFNALGHTAWSCDLQPADDGEDAYHLQMDAFAAIKGRKPDLVIAHPPCTRLALSGALRLYRDGKKANGRDPVKWEEMRAGATFFAEFFRQYSGPLCCENPIMHGHALALICPAVGADTFRQIVQPYEFGDDASKATVLWLRGLPSLRKGEWFPPRHVCPACGNTTRPPESDEWRDQRGQVRCHKCPDTPRKLSRWGNQTNSGQNKLPPSEHRAAIRAQTYEGIAQAMAKQWSEFLEHAATH